MLPLSKNQPSDFFSKQGIAYRVREAYSLVDTAYTLLLGVSLSLTRKTWIIEECGKVADTAPVTTSTEPISSESPDFQKAVQSAVDSYLKLKEKEYEEVLESTLTQNKSRFKLDETLPTLWLKSGEIRQGKVTEQNGESITIQSATGESETIPKSKIIRIKFPKENKP
jgi:hypothetical protein